MKTASTSTTFSMKIPVDILDRSFPVQPGEGKATNVPAFSPDSADDEQIRQYLEDADNPESGIQLSWLNDEMRGVSVHYNPLRSNYRRKHGDRFGGWSYESELVQTAAAIFAVVWLESRQNYPTEWVMVTHRHPYKSKNVFSERVYRSRCRNGRTQKSEEWRGRDDVVVEKECSDFTSFVQRASSYSMAEAIKQIITSSALEAEDYRSLEKEERVCNVEDGLFLGELPKRLRPAAECLLAKMTLQEAAEHLDCSVHQVKQHVAELRRWAKDR